MIPELSERALILAPHGRDAPIAATVLGEAAIKSVICDSLPQLVSEITAGAGFALVTEEAFRTADIAPLHRWLEGQPEWSDFPFVLLTERGGGLERNPSAGRFLDALGNVTFLERPFHPTTLISLARSALRGRRRQYEARARLEALRASEEKYRALFDSIDAGFCIVEMRFDETGTAVDYRFVEVNDAFEKHTGIAQAQGKTMREIAPDHEQHWFDVYGEVARTQQPLRTEYAASALADRWFEAYAYPTGEPGSNQVAILFSDITERRRMEAALRESEEDYRNAAELNPQVAWTAAPDGQLDRVAERWREWTGSSGLGDSWALGLHPDDRGYSGEAWLRSVTTGEPYDIEHRVQRLTGEYRWARSRAFPRYDAGGAILKWYGSTEDIHERKLAEERLKSMNDTLEQRVAARTAELEQAQEALRQSQKLEAMGQLTGGVAHDFNNLLTPIVGSLDLLQRKGLGSEREQRLIVGALQSADRAKTLVQRLLAFARRQPLRPTAVDLRTLIANMAELVASTSGPRVQIRLEVEDDLPPATADANQIEMALLNLAVNARDAMPQGGTLTISAAADDIGHGHRSRLPPGSYIRLAVSDTGTGMDEAVLAKAVEPFFTTKGVGQGTGLGLSMVHGLAAQLGGALGIRSEVGRGTDIELWLPISDDVPHYDDAPEQPAHMAQAGTALVVDDEDLVRASTADMLSEIGYHVLQARSAEDALTMLDGRAAVDLLVTDHLMPGMTGTDLAQRVRVEHPGMRVLVVSGYAEGKGISPDLPRLTKPFKQADLAASLSAL